MTWWFLMIGIGAFIVFYAADFLARRGTGLPFDVAQGREPVERLPVNHGQDAHATRKS